MSDKTEIPNLNKKPFPSKIEVEMPNNSSSDISKLWGIYISGIDEYTACKDEQHAKDVAKANTMFIAKHGMSKEMKVDVCEWPFDADSHTKSLKDWDYLNN